MARYASPLQDGHEIALLEGGQAFFQALIQALDASAHEVWLETYIFSFDASGERVAQALVRAAQRGVAVRVVMDGAGTPGVPALWAERFLAAGVQWHIYVPLGGFGWFMPSRWRRMHRKLCVVDEMLAFCGGINVLDDFFDPNHGTLAAPRLDYSVRVSGPLVRAASRVTQQFWWRLQLSSSVRERQFPSAWTALKAVGNAGVRHPSGLPALKPPQPSPDDPVSPQSTTHRVRAALLLRDNLRHRRQIERAYLKAIGEATDEVLIANAYFLPGKRLRRALVAAAARGVRVRLLLQGRYEYFMQYHASRPVYGALLAAGVDIVEYGDSFLHAKVAVIDGRWATVGSSNLDPLSLLLAREANVVVEDAAFARGLRQRLEYAMACGGQRVDPADFARRPWHQRAMSWLAFALMRALLFVGGKRY